MSQIFKWLVRGSALIASIFVLGALFLYLALLGTIPPDSGNVLVDELAGDAIAVIDKEGVPHIEAENLTDAARLLGYFHARDRLWQMELSRLAGQGRLSEVFGRITLDADIFLRTIDLAGSSRASFDKLTSETRDVLQAYADGVNHYIFSKPRLFSTNLQPEFLILGHNPEAWQPWQSVLIIKLMALTLGNNMAQEIERLALAARGLSPKEIDDVMPYGPKENPPPLPDLRFLYGFDSRGKVAGMKDVSPSLSNPDLPWRTGITASNNWVISGSRTDSGKPVLANDPHLDLTAPSAFYLAHLRYGEDGHSRNIIGGTLPGVPLVVVGRNDHVAWGLTTTVLDSQDLYLEQVNLNNPGQYRIETGWMNFEKTRHSIKIEGEDNFEFQSLKTRHGPVLPGSYKKIEKLVPEGHVLALRWTALSDKDTTMDAVLRMIQARSTQEYVSAAKAYVAPMQSMVVADTAGDIALIAPGLVPVRAPENLVSGRAPVPGWMPEYEWKECKDAYM